MESITLYQFMVENRHQPDLWSRWNKIDPEMLVTWYAFGFPLVLTLSA